MILKVLEVGWGCNCYIVGSEQTKEAMIIDPGGDAGSILDAVKKSGLNVKLIVITHGHIDHIGAVKEVKEATGAVMVMHADAIKSRSGQRQWARASGFTFPEPEPSDRLLSGGENIDIGDLHFIVINAPGHAPDSICLFGEGVVFVGDVLFQGGIGRYDFPTSNWEHLKASLARLMELPDETVVLPGHGPHTTIGQERRTNPFLNM